MAAVEEAGGFNNTTWVEAFEKQDLILELDGHITAAGGGKYVRAS